MERKNKQQQQKHHTPPAAVKLVLRCHRQEQKLATAAFQGHYLPPAVGVEPLFQDGDRSTVKISDLRKDEYSD